MSTSIPQFQTYFTKTKHRRAGLLSGLFLLAAPSMVFGAPGTLKDILYSVTDLLDYAVGFIMALALLGFIWGATKFIATAGDDTSRAEGRHMMIWGTLALFFMVSIWGIVRIIKLSFFGPA